MMMLSVSQVQADDYCGVLQGSSWKDAAGHSIHFLPYAFSFMAMEDKYNDIPFTCTANAITTSRFPEWTVTIAEDGKTAQFHSPDEESVWQLLAWPTDCNLAGQWLANGTSIKAYRRPGVTQGHKCVAESRVCNKGTLSGSFLFPDCVVQSRQMTPLTAVLLAASTVLIGWLAHRFLGRLS